MENETPEQRQSKGWNYRGGQVKRGGGEFYGDDDLGIQAALEQVGLSVDQMQSSQPDALVAAFAPLRELAKATPAVISVIDSLQAELRKGADSQAEICADYLKGIIMLLPGSKEACKTLLDQLPAEMPAVKLMRETLAQMPG